MPSYAPSEPDFGFDPSEISEQDDLLETLGGMDVPDVPVTETRAAQSAQPDYDYDIDAELASLFEGARFAATGAEARGCWSLRDRDCSGEPSTACFDTGTRRI